MIRKIKNLYLARIAIVTNIEYSGLFTEGKTFYKKLDNVYLLKETKSDYSFIKMYKILPSGKLVYAKSSDTKNIGDYFVLKANCLAEKMSKKFISDKQLLKWLAEFNKGEKNEHFSTSGK